MMPKKFRFFKGKPVKGMRRGRYGIILTMLARVSGQAGTQITISQAEWDQYGEMRELAIKTNDELREFV